MLDTDGLLRFAGPLRVLPRQELADKLIQSIFQWTELSDPKDDMSVLVLGGAD